jgi:hypothetical protein
MKHVGLPGSMSRVKRASGLRADMPGTLDPVHVQCARSAQSDALADAKTRRDTWGQAPRKAYSSFGPPHLVGSIRPISPLSSWITYRRQVTLILGFPRIFLSPRIFRLPQPIAEKSVATLLKLICYHSGAADSVFVFHHYKVMMRTQVCGRRRLGASPHRSTDSTL